MSTVSGMPEHRAIVHVGLTAYRRATYVTEALESVLAQSFTEWRLTVSDNGLGESEIESVIKPYLADPRIEYRPTGRDLSLAENWTTALTSGSGTYVAVLNDDDRWHPEFLQARVDVLKASPDCGFRIGAWVDIDRDGTTTGVAELQFDEGVVSCLDLANVFVRENPVVPPAILLRRSACEAVGAFFDGTFQYCDWELWARLASRFPAYYLARRDNDFRRHATTYTYGTREKPAQLLAMADHIELMYAGVVDGFGLGRIERARVQSEILLRAALDAHIGRGWTASRGDVSGRTPTISADDLPPRFSDDAREVDTWPQRDAPRRRGAKCPARASRDPAGPVRLTGSPARLSPRAPESSKALMRFSRTKRSPSNRSEPQTRPFVGGGELLRAEFRRPVEATLGEASLQLPEVDAVAAGVGRCSLRVRDATVRKTPPDGLGEVSDPVVLLRRPDVERVTRDDGGVGVEQSSGDLGNVADVHEGTPRHAVAEQLDLAGRMRPADEVVEDDVESKPR